MARQQKGTKAMRAWWSLVNAYLGWDEAEEGQGLVEYGLIIVLVSIVVVVALTTVGNQLNAIFNNITAQLNV